MATTSFTEQNIAGSRQPGNGRTLPVIPELDGVRGLAVILVMLNHSDDILPLPAAAQSLHLKALIDLGWSGVDLFFVLSGFLITGILIDSRDSKNYFSSFYARRVLRIFPLYLIAVFGYFHVALPLAHYLGYWRTLNNAAEPWFWFHLSNWKIPFGTGARWLTHFWSLAIEEQFYLFWPIIVFCAGRRWLRYVCLALIATSFGLRCFYAHDDFGGWAALYMLTPFRIEPLIFGSLAALLVRTGMSSTLKSARLLLGMATFGFLMLLAVLYTGRTSSFEHYPMTTYGFTGFALIFTPLVLYAYLYSGSSARPAVFLRRPWLRSFGKFSYAIYVLHVPIFFSLNLAVQPVSDALPEQLRFAFWLAALAAGIGLAYVAALISWQLIEKHFWALKRRFAVRY